MVFSLHIICFDRLMGVLAFYIKTTSLPSQPLSHSPSPINSMFWWGVSLGFPRSSVGKESACNAGDLCLIPGSGRYPGEGNGNPRQYACLENSMIRGAWQATVHRVAKSWTRLSDFHIHFRFFKTDVPVEAQKIWILVLICLQIIRSPQGGSDLIFKAL